jgi:hypothetical protein
MGSDKTKHQESPTTQLLQEMVDLFILIEELQDREFLASIELIDQRNREKELKIKNLQLEELIGTQSYRIKKTQDDLNQAISKSRRQLEEFRNLRAHLEMQLSFRDLEIERLRKELQRQSAIRKESAEIIQSEVSKYQALVDSFQTILHSFEERSSAETSSDESHTELKKDLIFRIK